MSYSVWIGPRTGATLWCADPKGADQVVLPDGVMDLMWFRDRLVIAGPDTRPMIFDRPSTGPTWGLRLGPGIAHALLGVATHELVNQRVLLSDVIGAAAGPDAGIDQDVPAGLERIATQLWRRADPERTPLRLAASLDQAARRGVSTRRAAVEHGLSERTLHRLSGRTFGYGFKTLAQIHRFQRALHLAQTGMPLGQVAAGAGYADQAHFGRECKKFAGTTPSRLVAVA